MKHFFLLLFLLQGFPNACAGSAEPLLKKGWAALVKDNDTTAIICFELAYETALKDKDTADMAASLLNLGICYYGVSQTRGLEYCFSAMSYYQKLEHSHPAEALQGRSRCLQLLITIYGRQGKSRQVIGLAREALAGFSGNDSSGYPGLTYLSLGNAYERLLIPDSAEIYFRQALQAQLRVRNMTYLPNALVNVADVELKKGESVKSRQLYARAFAIADSTGNRQAQVTALIGAGKWQLAFGNADSAARLYSIAKTIAGGLSDKSFYLRVLQQLMAFNRQQGNYLEALDYRDEIAQVQDSMNSYDRQKLAKSLEVQFNTAEKDRRLQLLKREKDIALLTNYLLWGGLVFLLLLSLSIIVFLRRINTRDRQLLQTKEALMKALEEQQQIRERYLQNEIGFKESQLSAMALQILQRNELMQELKQHMEESGQMSDPVLKRITGKGLNHDKEWQDFNAYFESINQNFYTRLRQIFPSISPNDLKICALIKLNLSSKDMAGILNISPDSVKTARYRLRKKLSLQTEESLSDFIRSL
jgi:hypothetical protein